MKTLLYLLRHGESDGNARHAFLGHTDLPLTDLGRRQAVAAGAFLEAQGFAPDVVYASDLCRAYETALLAGAYTGMKPIPMEGLREIFAGQWENRTFADIAATFADSFAIWHDHIGFACPDDGESVAALQKRILQAVYRIVADHPGQSVLIGTHATPLRMLETAARGWGIERAKDIPWATNASVSGYLCEGENITPLFYSLDGFMGKLQVIPGLG